MPVYLKITGKTDKPAVEFFTLAELAEALKPAKASKKRGADGMSKCRSKHSIQKLIEQGIIPDSNYRRPSVKIARGQREGQYIEGARLYSKDILVPKLVNVFKKIQQGRKITIEQRQEIVEAFEYERKYYSQDY